MLESPSLLESTVLLAGYLIGSIPFSYLVARWRGVDLRQVGSGNVGATNVLRSAGKRAGAVAFVLDLVKGAAASALPLALGADANGWLPAGAGVAAVVGHMFPVWLRFHGGKGVATGAGAFLPLAPLATVLAIAVFAGLAFATRLVSVASIAGAMALALFAAGLGEPQATYRGAAVAAALIAVKHHANISRLFRGEERRLGTKG